MPGDDSSRLMRMGHHLTRRGGVHARIIQPAIIVTLIYFVVLLINIQQVRAQINETAIIYDSSLQNTRFVVTKFPGANVTYESGPIDGGYCEAATCPVPQFNGPKVCVFSPFSTISNLFLQSKT